MTISDGVAVPVLREYVGAAAALSNPVTRTTQQLAVRMQDDAQHTRHNRERPNLGSHFDEPQHKS